ncbi:MAG: 5-oxoprolinase subunit PxpB [Saprospiraceae bacterium]|nr:5-oxoprolinase subunit PxpB [Pyrinomonadaceae bacterium]
MADGCYRIFPLGDNALTIEFGTDISELLNNKAISLAGYFEAQPFPGFIETVPAYTSTTIFYDLVTVRNEFAGFATAFEAVENIVENVLDKLDKASENGSRIVEIPVSFSESRALDLDFVAESNGLDRSEVIEIFISKIYRVYMLGFLPGFAYMGEVDERIDLPRKASPRLKVPKGSVGIAGRQTGIYPLESPGGWQIIGRTDVELFTPHEDSLCFLRPGDLVTFVEVETSLQ